MANTLEANGSEKGREKRSLWASGWSHLLLCVTADVGVVYADLRSAETERDDSDSSLSAGVAAIRFTQEKNPDWYN